jgi:hypothetical protein
VFIIADIARHRGESVASMLQTPTNLAVRGEPADDRFSILAIPAILAILAISYQR